MLLNLANNSIIFVQGASKGIGLAFVKRFLEDNSVKKVIASSRHPEESSLIELKINNPQKLEVLNLDLECQDSIDACSKKIMDANDGIDLILNASGFLHDDLVKPEKRISDLNLAGLTKNFSINTFGPILLTAKLLHLLKNKPHSLIVNISAKVGSIEDNLSGGWHSYRSSKAAQNMLTKNLAIELSQNKKFNTICVALHPGTVDTDLSRPFSKNVEPKKLFTTEESVDRLLKVINGLKREDSGCFFDWSGNKISW